VGDYDRMNWDFMDDLRKRHDLIRKWEKIVRNEWEQRTLTQIDRILKFSI